MVDVENGVIEFELDYSIIIAKDGIEQSVKDVKFKQPNRRTAPIFENLVSMVNLAQQDIFTVMDKLDPEQAEATKRAAKTADKKGEVIKTDKDMGEISEQEVMEEADMMIGFINNLTFDFEKAYKLFEKMILQEGRFAVCWISGLPINDVRLDKIDYRDLKKMLFLYISFFGKPVKSDTGSDSKTPSDSPVPVTEV